jgi:unsaturated chondroitin disaccharide hydrolase
MLAWQLDHTLMTENDRAINLLHRGLHHALATAQYNVYYGTGRDLYDTPAERGRIAHESLFNTTDGHYRCPSSQQGYSPFTTWTRGLAWILVGFSEQLEFLAGIAESEFQAFPLGTKKTITKTFLTAATATADWYLAHSFADGMVYWDAGAPNIPRCNQGECCQGGGSIYDQPSNPYNDHEPIDSSAAAIAAQGFYRLAKYLAKSDKPRAQRYRQAALLIAATLFDTPYLSTDPKHQGLILHSIYHRPNNWDHIPQGHAIPCGESSMWGDYHALELALLLHREIRNEPYITFFDR